ncbi:tape measure protein [Arsenophonus sp. PmNCSU2021_1]|uniref:tape measure protein n=1 Tax=Arsenophonus sp. PmNCSU2021_1 TaxID=3118989 RepID=UPI002FF195F1
MAEKKVKAAVIVDLLGTLPRQARLFGQSLVGMGRQGGASLHGLGLRANSLGSQLDRLGHQGQRTFSGLRLGLASVSSGFDHLETRAKAAYGGVARLYGLLAGGAALVGLKKAFIDPAAAMENYTIRLNAQNNKNKGQTDDDIQWATKNAKDTTWGLQGVIQEYTTSREFGMNREQARLFVAMLEDQGARHGWTLPEAQGASLQLKQMFSRKSIQAQDANLLTGYGVDVYSILGRALGKTRPEMQARGEKGLLGPESIRLLFQAMRAETKGAQKDAMNSWTGLTSQLGDVWQQFAVKVMNQGPFKRLKTELKDFLDVAGEAQESGLQDQWANRLASRFNGVFDSARRGITLFKNGLSRVNAELMALRQAGYGDTLDTIGKYAANTAKAMLAIYVASKLARVGMAIARPAWGLASAPVSVFVTNWPAGGVGGGSETYVDGSGRTRRKGSRLRPGRPALSVPRSRLGRAASAVSGFFGGLVNRTGARLSRLPGVSTVGRWLSGVGGGLRDMGQRARGLLGGATTRLSGFTGWLGRSAGALGRGAMRLGGPALTALSLAPTLLDKNASAEDKGGAVGSATGATVDGLVGAIGGPIGAVAGSMLGSVLGEKLGGWLGDIYARWDKQDEQQAMPPAVKAQADMRIALAPGLVLQNSAVTDSNAFGLQLDVYNGDNYHIY